MRSQLRGNQILRIADRYLGIPILAAAGAFKRPRPLPDRPERIGLMNSTNIGDTVLLSAVVRDLSAAFPEAEVVLFASSAVLPVARLIPGVRAVEIELGNPWLTIRALRREQLDVILDFDQWPRVEPLYCMFAAARWAGGFHARGQHRHYWFDGVVEHSQGVHELENYRALARLLNVESRSIPEFVSTGSLPAERLPSRPYVVLHMWPAGIHSELKEWPADRWRDLAAHLDARGDTVVLTGARVDSTRTRAFVAACGDLGGRFVDASGAYDLAGLVDVLAESRCVVSVNTGIMHLAAATGTPTIGLNGPTSDRRWGPVGERTRAINSSYDGCGYLHYGWEYRGRRTDCMFGVSVESVVNAMLELTRDF